MPPSDGPEHGQHDRDPRLEIPEILRRPVEPSNYDPVYGSQSSRPTTPELAGAVKAWAIALDFVVTIIAGAGLGYLADRWLHTLPAGTLIGLALGFGAAFVRIVRATQRQERLERERRSRTTPNK